MDHNTTVSEVQSSQRDGYSFRILKPINPETYGDRVNALWEKLKALDYVFDDFTYQDPRAFAILFTQPDQEQFEVGNWGYALVRRPWEKGNAEIHFAMWDKSIGTDKIYEAGQELLHYLFDYIKVERCTAEVPTYNIFAKRVATVLGFKFEGEMRNAILFKGKHHGVMIYGLLQREFQKRMVT